VRVDRGTPDTVENFAGVQSATGGFGDGEAQQIFFRFTEPVSLFSAADHTVYVADTGNHALRNVTRGAFAVSVIIAGVGYEPSIPSLRWPDGRPLRLASDDTGVQITESAQLVSAEGAVLPELLALGLGAGLPASGELAGEPSYAGRLDSVSLYQAEVGRIVLDSLLGPAHS